MSKKQSYRVVSRGNGILTQIPVTKINHTVPQHTILNSLFRNPFVRVLFLE